MNVGQELKKIRSSISPEQERRALVNLWIKSFIILTWFFLSLGIALYYPGEFWQNLVAMIIAAIAAGAILLNIVHEAVHYSYSRNRRVNQLWGLSLTMLGSSSILWRERHTFSHHYFTNVLDKDVDVPPTNQNLIRVSKKQPKMWFHKFQHLYALYLYAYFPMFNVFVEEFVALATNKCNIKEKKLRGKIFIELVIAKAIYGYFFIYVPIANFGIAKGIILYFLFNLAAGVATLYPLMVGHITDGSPLYDEDEKPTWIEHQVRTTINYSLNNSLMTWYTGGNNYHIEHHLFPNVNHIHYPQIAGAVKAMCEQNNLEYREYKSFIESLKHFLNKFRELGNQ